MDRFGDDPFAFEGERPRQQSASLRRSQAVIPTGPRLFARVRKATHFGGPGLLPEGFEGTQDEWEWYYPSMRVLDPLRDPRIGPFRGGTLWEYQSPELGAYTRQRGSAVADVGRRRLRLQAVLPLPHRPHRHISVPFRRRCRQAGIRPDPACQSQRQVRCRGCGESVLPRSPGDGDRDAQGNPRVGPAAEHDHGGDDAARPQRALRVNGKGP
jgi:hypothetical protein